MTYVKGEASVTVAVNVPAHTDQMYTTHAKRIVKLLNQGGYEAYAMSHEWILKMAAEIEEQVRQSEEAQELMNDLISNRKDD